MKKQSDELEIVFIAQNIAVFCSLITDSCSFTQHIRLTPEQDFFLISKDRRDLNFISKGLKDLVLILKRRNDLILMSNGFRDLILILQSHLKSYYDIERS